MSNAYFLPRRYLKGGKRLGHILKNLEIFYKNTLLIFILQMFHWSSKQCKRWQTQPSLLAICLVNEITHLWQEVDSRRWDASLEIRSANISDYAISKLMFPKGWTNQQPGSCNSAPHGLTTPTERYSWWKDLEINICPFSHPPVLWALNQTWYLEIICLSDIANIQLSSIRSGCPIICKCWNELLFLKYFEINISWILLVYTCIGSTNGFSGH